MLKSKVSKIVSIIAGLIFILVLGAIITYNIMLSPVSKDITTITFEIPYKTTSNEVLNSLKNQGLIKNTMAAKIYMKLNKITNIQAGIYELNKAMSTSEILKSFKDGKVVEDEVTITFIEGKRIPYYVETITKNFNYTVDEVNALLTDKEFLTELITNYWFISEDILNKDIYYPLEGYFFPDTYNFRKEASIKEIILTLINGLANKLAPYKKQIENSGYTAHQILTLASIVELEGVNNESRSGVASVFYNRLKDGWTLGSDVTTYYAVKKDFSVELTQRDLETCNPYNTRSNCVSGLPVGPICSSGLESIVATINPLSTDYYYFVADKNKKTYYAKNQSEFNEIIADLKKQGLWYIYN